MSCWTASRADGTGRSLAAKLEDVVNVLELGALKLWRQEVGYQRSRGSEE